jgi:hypothetical protein
LQKSVLLAVLLLVCALCALSSRAAAAGSELRRLSANVAAFQKTTWHWQRVMGVPLSGTHGRTLALMSVEDVRHAARLWQSRAEAAFRRAQHPPNRRAWLCIHRYEGSWRDTGAPYYGGLQMDIGFQRRYGGHLLRTKGTADRWTPLEQIWVAEKARRSGRGFHPWPNTARYCGLI